MQTGVPSVAKLIWRTLFVAIAVAVLSQCLPMLPTTGSAKLPALDGTFIQLHEEHSTWTRERWQEMFEEFRQMRLKRIIVQWSVLNKIAFFPLSGHGAAVESPIESILRLADDSEMEILVGLSHEEDFWNRVDGVPRDVDQFLRQRFADSLSVAKGLWPLARKHKSFKGWYVSEEIEDLTWRGWERRQVLAARLGALTTSLHRLAPWAHIAVSGFASGKRPAAELRVLWGELLDAAPHVDIVLFQDGIGVGNLNLQQLPEYLDAMRSVTQTRGRRCEVITEVFQQVAGGTLDRMPFKAISAPIARIDQQLLIAVQYCSAIIAFSVPEYVSSHAGGRAAALYQSYVRRLRSAGLDADDSNVNIPDFVK